MPIDFRAAQIQSNKLIASGSTGTPTGAKLLIYPHDADDASTPNQGYIDQAIFNTGSIGTDIFLYVSGGIGKKNIGGSQAITVFGGDVHISGNLTVDGTYPAGGGGGGSNFFWSPSNLSIEASGSLTITGSGYFKNGLSGSLQQVSPGVPYLVAGPNITIATNSLGQVSITGSASGGGGSSFYRLEVLDYYSTNATSDTTAGQVIFPANQFTGSIILYGVISNSSATATGSIRLYNVTSGAYVEIGGPGNEYLSVVGTTPIIVSSVNLISASNFNSSSQAIYELQVSSSNGASYGFFGGFELRPSGSFTGVTYMTSSTYYTYVSGTWEDGGNKLATTSSVALAGNLGTGYFANVIGTDTFLFVSGIMGGKDGGSPGVAVFGGDVVISGTLHGGSPLKVGSSAQFFDDVTAYLKFNQGNDVSATGDYSHAQGQFSSAQGLASHAEGNTTTATGDYSHAEGGQNTASGEASHSEGVSTVASGFGSHAEGQSNTASGLGSHAEGGGTTASGSVSHSEGADTVAQGDKSHAEGDHTLAAGTGTHAEGYYTTGSGNYSHTEGYITNTIGNYSHAEGANTNAYGDYSHTEGANVYANAIASHAEGYTTYANGDYSHAEGYNSVTIGQASHAEGLSSTTSGSYSHAEGSYTTASGSYSHAEGIYTFSIGEGSHSEGIGTIASGSSQHVQGRYNKRNNDFSLFVIGDGTGDLDTQRGDVVRVNAGPSIGTGRVEVTGSLVTTLGLSGSLTKLTDGSSYLTAGSGIVITSQSNGSVNVGSTIWEWNGQNISQFDASNPISGSGQSGTITFGTASLAVNKLNTSIDITATWGGSGGALAYRVATSEGLTLPQKFRIKLGLGAIPSGIRIGFMFYDPSTWSAANLLGGALAFYSTANAIFPLNARGSGAGAYAPFVLPGNTYSFATQFPSDFGETLCEWDCTVISGSGGYPPGIILQGQSGGSYGTTTAASITIDRGIFIGDGNYNGTVNAAFNNASLTGLAIVATSTALGTYTAKITRLQILKAV